MLVSLKVIKTVLIDLSGTLHRENEAITGAVEALKKLRASGVKIRFVTNTTKESKNVLHTRLANCGFELKKEEIFSSLTAAHQYVKERDLNPMLMLEPDAVSDFEGTLKDGDVNAVVIGLTKSNFHYERLNEAFRHVMNGAELVAIHKGRYFSRADGLALGPGPFVVGLEYATGKTATVIGKPQKSFFLSALQGLDCQPHETVMIGDDVRDDVEGALSAGLKAILVRTGKYLPGDEDSIPSPPTAVCNDFPEAVERILSSITS